MAFTDLYKQSIYFEIYSLDDKGKALTLVQSFAFTMPPTSIDITYPQRVTTTPTPGGFFVDNYGQNGCKISISGDTGNYESRMTVYGKDMNLVELTGQECWKEFRDRIVFYSQQSTNYTMKFYDLTHKGTGDIFYRQGTGRKGAFAEAWEVVLDDVILKRSEAKPFHYPYTINLTGIRQIGSFQPQLSSKNVELLSNTRNKLQTVTDKISAFNDNMQDFLNNSLEYLNPITDIFSQVAGFMYQLSRFTDQILAFERKLGGVFDQVIQETTTSLNFGVQLVEFPFDALDTAKEELTDIVAQTQALVVNAKAAGKDTLSLYGFGDDENIDPVSNLSQSAVEIEEPFNEIMLTAKQEASYEPIAAVLVNGVVTSVYGYSEYQVKGNTRLDRLALDVYGDPNYKEVISAVNGIYANDELTSGTTIKLPILQPETRFTNNAVYNTPSESADVLGRAAMVDSDGKFITNPSGYALTTGAETVYQSIIFRLSEQKGRQIKDGSYGVVAKIGSALNNNAPFEILGISIKETLIQDPRITNVYGLKYQGVEDKIYQEFKFDTITRETVSYSEGI